MTSTEARRNVLLLALCQALMMSGNTLAVATSALVGLRLAPDPSLATLPLALQFLATMLSTAPASLYMRRHGRRAGFRLGALLGLVGALVAATAIGIGSYAGFCAGAALVGSFNAFGLYYRFAAADVATPDLRARAISYVMAGGVIAAFAGPLLANWGRGAMASAEFGGSYLGLAGLYLLTLLALQWARIPHEAVAASAGSGRALAAIAAQPRFVAAAAAAMLGYGIMALVMTATPLAMAAHGHPFGDTAIVIQWHVLGMFAPSFFTGQLIQRFGVVRIMASGAAAIAACVAINLAGSSLWQFWSALLLLGIGWNFLFVGGTTLLTETYAPEEKAKTQALNDFLVFATVAAASLSAGALQHAVGWRAVNIGVIPLILLIGLALLQLRREPARASAA